MMMRIWAFITRQRLIWLRDRDGEVVLRPGRITPFGIVVKRHWPYSIRDVVCVDGGKVMPDCYVREWRDAKTGGVTEYAKIIREAT